jgi:hypothetical protein
LSPGKKGKGQGANYRFKQPTAERRSQSKA